MIETGSILVYINHKAPTERFVKNPFTWHSTMVQFKLNVDNVSAAEKWTRNTQTYMSLRVPVLFCIDVQTLVCYWISVNVNKRKCLSEATPQISETDRKCRWQKGTAVLLMTFCSFILQRETWSLFICHFIANNINTSHLPVWAIYLRIRETSLAG